MQLSDNEFATLWNLFDQIHKMWGGDECRVEDMASRWREFIEVKVDGSPSYLDYYQDACILLSELENEHGDDLYQFILIDAELHREPEPRLTELKRYVIDEFIRVYVSSGGFRSYGSRNYGGFVSGSRYRAQRPYRTHEGQ